MKLLALLPLLLCSCADEFFYPNGQLEARLMSDRVGEKLTVDKNGVGYSSASALHSPVARAHWHGASLLAADAVGAAIGLKGGTAAFTAATSIIAGTQTVNRPTSRPQALTAH